MKRTVLIIFAAVLVAGAVQAADFATNPNPASAPSGAPYVPDLPNITQSTDPVNVVAGSLACGDGTYTTDNAFLRRFFLNTDHGIVVQYNVTSVDMGLETVNIYVGTSVPISVRTYSLASGAAFTYAEMGAPLANATRDFTDGTSLVVENWPVTGSIIDPVAEDLVVEMFYPDAANNEWGIWPGSNSGGQTQPGYLAAIDCGIAEPTDIAVYSATMHLIMTVNGDEQVVPTPTNPPITAGEPVPAMNRFGIVAMVVLLVGVAILVMWRRS